MQKVCLLCGSVLPKPPETASYPEGASAYGLYRGLEGQQTGLKQSNAAPKPRIDRLVIERVASGFVVATGDAIFEYAPRHAVSTFPEMLAKIAELLA